VPHLNQKQISSSQIHFFSHLAGCNQSTYQQNHQHTFQSEKSRSSEHQNQKKERGESITLAFSKIQPIPLSLQLGISLPLLGQTQ
jgi:hypothetical protein